MALQAEFVPIVNVKVGDRRVGGTVAAIRYSKSGKSVWMTMDNGRGGLSEWPRESTCIRTAVFTDDGKS